MLHNSVLEVDSFACMFECDNHEFLRIIQHGSCSIVPKGHLIDELNGLLQGFRSPWSVSFREKN